MYADDWLNSYGDYLIYFDQFDYYVVLVF
jgi:hypothetical protein